MEKQNCAMGKEITVWHYQGSYKQESYCIGNCSNFMK